jgi:hypothetical protein
LRAYQALANNAAMTDLNIAEIPHENGGMRFRYARKMSPDGSRWIRHGLFVAYHPNGVKASEGSYEEGVEQGAWRDYHGTASLPLKVSMTAARKLASGATGTRTVSPRSNRTTDNHPCQSLSWSVLGEDGNVRSPPRIVQCNTYS